MKIEKISQSCIKPSSPTPPRLKTYNVSLIDQFLMYGMDIPMLFFYSNPNPPANIPHFISQRSQLLRQSLAKTLTHYYPLAGRIKDHLSVDCNDDGVYYVEARADISLSEYFGQPDYLRLMDSLLPRQASGYETSSPGSYVVMIQETSFACGGITIGLFGSHMVMDAAGLISFVKSWAATSDEREIIPLPSFDGSSFFPHYDSFPKEATLAVFDKPFLNTGRYATRTFTFDEFSLSDLKTQVTNPSLQNPTRIEVVTSFLIECISDICKAKSGIDKPFAFTYIASWKQRARPQLPENLFGNFVWMASGISIPEETKLPSLVYKVRETLRTIDANFVKNNIQIDGAFSKLSETIKETTRRFTNPEFGNGVNFVMVSSLCNVGLYEVDFGWGKPIWVTCVDVPLNSTGDQEFLNSMAVVDSRKGKGIEAWLYMDEEDLVSLEKYHKLLQYASVCPTPLKPELAV